VSSAILYLAIVVIWALVLVPRWLHSRSGLHRPTATIENEVPAPEAEHSGSQEAPGSADALSGSTTAPAAAPQARADASPAARRGRMLQARRRTLGALALLTLGAVVLAVTHLAASWIIAPPALMLAGFLVLLREAALIDAERRHGRTLARHNIASSGDDSPVRATGAAERARQTPSGPMVATGHGTGGDAPPGTARPGNPDVAPGLEPAAAYGVGTDMDAHVIDISGRVDGQFYDQYTDAVDRAVGD
jgi:hypothetical protein